LRDDRKTLRLSRLEELLDTRKTLCDIAAGNTSGMEGTHGKLCTRLTDGLCRDNSDSLSDLNALACRHVGSVALRADTDLGLTGQDCTDLDLLKRLAVLVHTLAHNTSGALRSDHMVRLHNDVAVLVLDGVAGETACDTLLQALDLRFSFHARLAPPTRNLVFSFGAVCLANDQVLGYVYKTSRQVTGVCGTKSRIGQTLAGSMRRHEVFQYVQT